MLFYFLILYKETRKIKIKKIIILLFTLFLLVPIVFANVWENVLIADNAIGENGAFGIFSIDLDGDGDTDFIGGINVNDQIRWYDNQGNGTYLNKTVAVSNGVGFVEAADMDNDGDIDIVAAADAGADSNGLQLFTNDGSESFSTTTIDTTRSRPLKLIDFDGDGDIDIVSGTIIEDTVLLWLNNGFGSFTRNVVASTFDQVGDIRVIDIDKDGDNDILAVASGVTSETAWFENDGSNTVFSENTIDSTANTKAADGADLDGDDDIDIVINTGVSVLLYTNEGVNTMSFTKSTLSSSLNGGRDISIADIDNDRDNDIFYTADTLSWFDNDGTATFINKTVYNPSSALVGIHINDFDDDGALDIAIADSGGDEFRWFRNLFADIACDFPSLFCDDFNYITSMQSTKGWFVRNNDRSLDSAFTPISNELNLRQGSTFKAPSHTTGTFPVDYRTTATTRRITSKFSPIFSTEFELNFANNTNNVLEFEASSEENQGGYVIRSEVNNNGNASGNMDWFYLNNSASGLEYIKLCGNCTLTETDLNIKINTFFSHRAIFPFNATIPQDTINVYSNNILLGTFNTFITTTDYLGFYAITKFSRANFTIDNYVVMAGVDKNVDLSILGFLPLFDEETIEDTFIEGTGTGDMADALNTIWDDMGLQSVTSKLMAGMFLMFFLALLMVGMAFKTNHPISARVIIIVELFFMILLVFVKLLPIWLPFILVIIAAGIGAVVVKLGTQT